MWLHVWKSLCVLYCGNKYEAHADSFIVFVCNIITSPLLCVHVVNICSSLSVAFGKNTACRATVSPLKRKLKKHCWTVQLSYWYENCKKTFASCITTERGAFFAKRPFGPSLLHAFSLPVNSKISETRANSYNSCNSHVPPVISLPLHLLLYKCLIFPQCSAVLQIVLNSATHPYHLAFLNGLFRLPT